MGKEINADFKCDRCPSEARVLTSEQQAPNACPRGWARVASPPIGIYYLCRECVEEFKEFMRNETEVEDEPS